MSALMSAHPPQGEAGATHANAGLFLSSRLCAKRGNPERQVEDPEQMALDSLRHKKIGAPHPLRRPGQASRERVHARLRRAMVSAGPGPTVTGGALAFRCVAADQYGPPNL